MPRFKRPQVLPPTPFLLASCVDPGPSVHEWKEHGFRLTVQKGSLHRAIGPIKIQEFFQVVKCEDDSQFYLVKTRVDCQPSGTTFPDNSLLMDFMVKDTPVDKIAQTFQVCVHCTKMWPTASIPPGSFQIYHAADRRRSIRNCDCFMVPARGNLLVGCLHTRYYSTYQILRRAAVGVAPTVSGAPHIKSSLPHPSTDERLK